MNSLEERRFHPSPRQRVRWVIAASVLLHLVCGRVCAADHSQNLDTEGGLEALLKIEIPVVTAASKIRQSATEAPSSITVVGAEEIKRYGYRTLADILQSVRGLHVSYDRTYSSLGFRGFTIGGFGNSNDRVLVLVNGHRINNSLTDGAFIGTEFILDVDLIEQVEVIRGPGSVLYGGNALFGVINVVTRKGRELTGYGGEVSAEAANYDTYKGRVTYGHLFKNDLEVLLSGTLYDSQGQEQLFFKEYATNTVSNGVARNGDYDNFRSFFGNVSFHDLSLEGAFISREKGIPTALTGTVFDEPRTRVMDDRSYLNLRYSHEFSEVADVTAQVYYDRQDSQLDAVYYTPQSGVFQLSLPRVDQVGKWWDAELQKTKRFPERQTGGGVLPLRPSLARLDQLGEWWGAELQLTKRFLERHTVTLGAEYRDDFHQGQRYVFPAALFSSQTNRTTYNYGVYLAGDFTLLTNHLHLSAGARYDQYADQDPTANPRVALIYNPVAQSTIKAIYGTAFRAPNFFERINGTSGLGPETITTYELVYEQGLGTHLRASVSGFYNQMDDVIRQNSLGFFANVDHAEARGMEAELEARWPELIGRISYTFQAAKDRITDKVLTDSPRHLFKLNLSVPVIKEKLFAGFDFQYVSARTTLRTLAFPDGLEAARYSVVNFTLFSRNLVKGLEISARVYNLLDEQYGDPSTPFHVQDVIPRDGRSFRVKLTYRF